MANIRTRITNVIMKLSYQERRKKGLDAFNHELQKLRQMDMDELKYEHIVLQTKCERKQGILTFFIISVALAVLMNVWNKFFSFMQTALKYASSSGIDSAEISTISLVISITVTIFVTFSIFLLLFFIMNDISKMKKRLLLIEEVMRERENNTSTN